MKKEHLFRVTVYSTTGGKKSFTVRDYNYALERLNHWKEWPYFDHGEIAQFCDDRDRKYWTTFHRECR